MDMKEKIEQEILDLINETKHLALVKEEIYKYHPQNPEYINVIRAYDSILERIKLLERTINGLEGKLDTLNQLN